MQQVIAWIILFLSFSKFVSGQGGTCSCDGSSGTNLFLRNTTVTEGHNAVFTCNTPGVVTNWFLDCLTISPSDIIKNNSNRTITFISVSSANNNRKVTCNVNGAINYTACLLVTPPPESTPGGLEPLYIYIIVGASFGALILLLCVIVIILLACCCIMKARRTIPTSPLIPRTSSTVRTDKSFRMPLSSTVVVLDPIDEYRKRNQTESMMAHPPILKDQFTYRLDTMKMNDNQKFMEEFGTIPMVVIDKTRDVATSSVNMPKNRYDNILPYDDNRVKLSFQKYQEGSDYINASYLDGHCYSQQYIATQGPLPDTVGDFWRMVWEQDSRTIVMVTNLQEKATVKCGCYWPTELNVPSSYGGVDVTLVETVPLANYTMRTFSIVKGSVKDTRGVKQFHFTTWPDHGVPEFPTSMLSMVRCVRAHHDKQMDTGPMVVHCSAGVGRTGTFVIIDSMVQRILNGGVDIDIYAHLCLLRNQRNHMVQTEDQYFFIHEAINEAIACGVTDVTPEVFPTYLDRLELIQEDGESSLLELEFKKLATDRTEPHLFASATRNVNKGKNRFVNIMPYEYNRVKLSFLRATEGSDYINASYIDSYRQQHAFIATQGPLKHTSSDFWRMIWEKKSPIIVMLTRLEERQQECSAYYWSDTEVKHGDITVKMSTRRAIGDYCIYRDFTLTDNQSNRTHLVRHYQYLGWPERGVPTSALPLLQIIQEVQEIYATLRTTDPITVMCSSGVGRTGVFITLHIILERYEVEGYIDLFQTVKMLRIQRSAMVQTHEQYHFCYEAVLDYLLNTGQLPHIRSLSITRRSSHINLTNPSSPTLHSPVEIMSSPVGSQHALNGTTNEMTSVV